MEELANTHKQRKERDNVQIIKGNKQPWKRHVNIWDTVYGPINSIGARSVRPLHVGHVPKDLAPFIVLLEVRIALLLFSVLQFISYADLIILFFYTRWLYSY